MQQDRVLFLKKIAAFFLFLESDSPGITLPIFDYLDPILVKKIIKSMAEIDRVDAHFMQEVIQEFHGYLVEKESLVGGKMIAKMLTRHVLKHNNDHEKLEDQTLFFYLLDLPEDEFLSYLKQENQQVVAAILNTFDTDMILKIFEKLDPNQVKDITQKMKTVSPLQSKILQDYHVYLYQSIQQYRLNFQKEQKVSALSKLVNNFQESSCRADEIKTSNLETPKDPLLEGQKESDLTSLNTNQNPERCVNEMEKKEKIEEFQHEVEPVIHEASLNVEGPFLAEQETEVEPLIHEASLNVEGPFLAEQETEVEPLVHEASLNVEGPFLAEQETEIEKVLDLEEPFIEKEGVNPFYMKPLEGGGNRLLDMQEEREPCNLLIKETQKDLMCALQEGDNSIFDTDQTRCTRINHFDLTVVGLQSVKRNLIILPAGGVCYLETEEVIAEASSISVDEDLILFRNPSQSLKDNGYIVVLPKGGICYLESEQKEEVLFMQTVLSTFSEDFDDVDQALPKKGTQKEWVMASMMTFCVSFSLIFLGVGLNEKLFSQQFFSSTKQQEIVTQAVQPQQVQKVAMDLSLIKQDYEASLKHRLSKKVKQMLGHNHFNIDVKANLIPQLHKPFLIKQLTIKIYVHSQETILKIGKQAFFNEIARHSGYLKGRDRIELVKQDNMVLADQDYIGK